MREAQERLRDDTDEGGARAATERVLHELIPGVKTLLNPDAEEVKKLTDTVPQALLLACSATWRVRCWIGRAWRPSSWPAAPSSRRSLRA